MNWCLRTREAHAEAWRYLREGLRADIALVQEAVPPDGLGAVYRPFDGENPRYAWGSAVVSLSPRYSLRPRTRRPLNAPHSEGELPDSHPGAVAVADVVDAETDRVLFNAVSFYTPWDYLHEGRDAIY